MKGVFIAGMLFVLAMVGCGKVNEQGTVLDASGKHPANWASRHGELFRATPGATDSSMVAARTSCAGCHGSDLKGGISKVSCFSQQFAGLSCHVHPVGIGDPAVHGPLAKGFGTGTVIGMRSCQGCHGTVFAGGVLSPVSCQTCHGIAAPHPANWIGHSGADQRNAAACAACHANRQNLTTPLPPFTAPAPPGTRPGCFNATLCHQGHSFPYPGAAHRSVPLFGPDTFITLCGPCHDYASPTGTYPVPRSTPPACAGCHIANFGNGCADCHGDSFFGRPNGGAFPNRQGGHVTGDHGGFGCTTCHLYTTGDARHGWSGGVMTTSAADSIRPSLQWNPGTRAPGQGSCNPAAGGMAGCHGVQAGRWY